MELIPTVDAVGAMLCHDITQIIPGVKKGPLFRKGHVVTEEDIPLLLSVGKQHLYVWREQPGLLHEDDAAAILRDVCVNENIRASLPVEGKIELNACCDGLLQVDRALLSQINGLGEMMIATRMGDTPVKAGDKLAGTRIIPLLIAQEKMQRLQRLCGQNKLLRLLPFQEKTAAILTTGNEVYQARIEDRFTPVVEAKLQEYHCQARVKEILDDDPAQITQAILRHIDEVDVVICTGGMSVDPDDRTPLAIKQTGAEVISYGAPVLPGAMFLLAYLDGKPVVGLPGCVMYAKRTIFDLVLPRLLVGDPISAQQLAALGEGGLCLDCPVCTYPACGFGKGRVF